MLCTDIFLFISLSHVVREQKTKPTQTTVKELRTTGLSPDFLVCRASTPLEEVGWPDLK